MAVLNSPGFSDTPWTRHALSLTSATALHRLHIYLDTPVIGGCYDEEFAEDSRRLFEAIRNGRAVALLSPITTEELEDAPRQVRQVLDSLPPEQQEGLPLTDEVSALAQAYLDAGIVSANYAADALHIAFATVYTADVLTSWNFRHIVNLRRIQQFNAVNLAQGYRTIEIRSPRELFVDEDNDG